MEPDQPQKAKTLLLVFTRKAQPRFALTLNKEMKVFGNSKILVVIVIMGTTSFSGTL